MTPPQVTLQPSASTAVTLGLYSGRPNPQWELTADQDTHLHQIVASLPRVSGVAPQGGLGYSGFTVAVIGPDGRGQVVIAYAKTVALQGIASTWHWRDEAGLVERFLLDTGKPSLAAAEYAAAKQALDNLLP